MKYSINHKYITEIKYSDITSFHDISFQEKLEDTIQKSGYNYKYNDSKNAFQMKKNNGNISGIIQNNRIGLEIKSAHKLKNEDLKKGYNFIFDFATNFIKDKNYLRIGCRLIKQIHFEDNDEEALNQVKSLLSFENDFLKQILENSNIGNVVLMYHNDDIGDIKLSINNEIMQIQHNGFNIDFHTFNIDFDVYQENFCVDDIDQVETFIIDSFNYITTSMVSIKEY